MYPYDLLVPHRERRSRGRFSSEARRVLEERAGRADSDVIVISGRPRAAMAALLENSRVTAAGSNSPGTFAPMALDRGQTVLLTLRSRYGAAWSESGRVIYPARGSVRHPIEIGQTCNAPR